MKRRAQSVPTRTEVQHVPQSPAAAESTGIDLPTRTCQSPQQIQHNFNVSPGLCFSFFFFAFLFLITIYCQHQDGPWDHDHLILVFKIQEIQFELYAHPPLLLWSEGLLRDWEWLQQTRYQRRHRSVFMFYFMVL